MSQALLYLLLLCAEMPSMSAVGYDPIGVLTPTSEFGIVNSVSNLNEVAAYTFSFIPTTTIPVGGLLTIRFPQQFSTGLGVSGTPVCSGGTCTVTGWTVTITLTAQAMSGLQTVVVVSGVKNPIFAGGTGPFGLVSYSGTSVLDMNLEFGVIGISDAVKTMASASVALSPGFSGQVGDASSYDFFFRTERGITLGNWVGFIFPTTFILSTTPTCSAVQIEGYSLPGAFTCKTSGSLVTLTGLLMAVPAGTNACVRISATNPLSAGTTLTFTLETGRTGTNSIFERISGVSGVVIAPGKVTGISMAPADPQMMMTAGKVMPYVLRFTLTNPVVAGGMINVLFNAAFNIGVLTGAYIITGLNDLSSTQIATLTYTVATFKLVITNFASYSKQEIGLFLPLTNPGTAGNTPPLVIYSLLSDGVTLIDQDTVSAYVFIVSTTAPILSPTFLAGTQAGIAISLQINITPNVQIPALGYVAIRLPSGFQVTTALPTCLAKPLNIGLTTAACIYANGIIKIQLFATTVVANAGPGDFVVGFVSFVQVTAGIVAASSAGTYYLEVNTYDTTNTLLESGNCLTTLTPTLLTTFAFSSLHTKLNTPTILIWSLTPLQAIPQSQVSQGAQGFIEIQLPTQVAAVLYFLPDLGLGLNQGNSVPCLGITNISGLTCVLTVKPVVGSNIFITVSGFSALPANTPIVFHFPGIKHSQANGAAPTVTLTLYQMYNRIRTNLNTQSTALLNTPSAVGTAQNDAINVFASTSMGVSTKTTISGVIKFVTAIAALPSFVFFQVSTTHDNGYCAATTSSFSCVLGGLNYPCTCYAVVDIVLLNLGSYTIAANTAVPIVLSNLYNPNSVAASNDKVTVYTIGSSVVKDAITYTNTLPAQIPGAFLIATAIPSVTGAGYVNVLYTFNLVGTHAIPQGGSVLITFPALFTLTSSVPVPICAVTGLTQATVAGVSCILGAVTIKVTNFLQATSAQPILITVSGVKNPGGTGGSGTFWFTTANSSGLTIDTNSNVAGFTFSAAFVTKVMIPNSITALPSNAGVLAEYVLKFIPANPIAAGGTINVVFPTQFTTMPTTFTCRFSTPITTMKSCALSGNTFTITLDKPYTSSVLTLSFFSIQNFATAGTSSAFSISTMYDGVVLDQTATTSARAVVIITAAAPALTVNKVSFSPTNEGESSIYTFNFLPTVGFSALQHPVVAFPLVYDKKLGTNLSCWASGLLGTLTCSVLSAYQITVTGHKAFSSCGSCSIVLYISGILNPPATAATGAITLGMLSGNTYLQYQSSAANLLVSPAPTLLYLNSYTASNFNARYSNVFLFNVTTTQSIPSTASQGGVWILFPEQFLLQNSVVTANSSINWAAGTPNVTQSNNTIQLTGQATAFTGTILLQLSNVPNPLQALTTNSIILKTVDAFNALILDRTYVNLNPTEMTFVFTGPLISVNNDQPIVIQTGTYSGPISIAVAYPCTRNLTFTPMLEGFIISPASISLAIGQLSATFTIGAPVTVTTIQNVILWTVSGEANPPYYSPLAKTIVLVQNSSLIAVNIDSIPPVPIGGISLPIRVYLDYGPVNDLTVDFQVNPVLTGVTVFNASVTFTAGQTEQWIHLLAIAGLMANTGVLYLSLSGSDSSLYTLTNIEVDLSIFNNTDNFPLVSTLSVIQTTKTTATVSVATNTQGILHYMYAYAGTAVPDFIEVESFGPAPYDATRSRYGNLTIDESHTGTVVLSNLQAGRNYIFFAYLADLVGRVSITNSSVTFATMPLAQSASVSLRFIQAYMNDYEVSLVKSAIELILSLADWQTTTMSSQYTSSGGRRLAGTGQTYTVLTFAIVDNPFNDNYPSPIDLTTLLNANVNVLSNRVNNLDTSYGVVGTVSSSVDCQFVKTPILYAGGRTDQTLSFSAALNSAGVIYAISVLGSRDTGRPYSWQVQSGLSAGNIPTTSISKSVSGSEVWNATYTNLLPNSSYNLYFTCGNAQPVFPALLPDIKVISLVANTTATPNPKMLVITGSQWMMLGVVVSLVVLL